MELHCFTTLIIIRIQVDEVIRVKLQSTVEYSVSTGHQFKDSAVE